MAEYGDGTMGGDEQPQQIVQVVVAAPTTAKIREVHTGTLSSCVDVPCVGGCFSSIRLCACHCGVEFIPDTFRQTNWCLPYHRYALYNDDRTIGQEAIAANGVRVQLSTHAQAKIRGKAATMNGKVFRVSFNKFNPLECFCLCCVCADCCPDVVIEDTVEVHKIWYGREHQEPCLPCHACTRALMCCQCLFPCCEESVNLNIRDVAYIGAPIQQYMG